MDLGLTIRKIRVEKGLTQKEVCKGIVTMSYYSRIERNISEPTISVFLEILQRLNISFDEFMFIHLNYKESSSDFWWYRLSDLYHSGNIEELQKINTILETSSNKNVLQYIVQLCITRLRGNIPEPNENMPIVNKLMTMDLWTSEEIKIFISIMDILPLETVTVIVNRILKKRTLYSKSKGFHSPYNKILINSTLLCIDASQFSKAKKYLIEYQKSLDTRDFYGRAMAVYLEGLLLVMTGDSTIGKQKINRFFDICESLDLNHFSKKYKDYFERLTNKK
ncbi:helix-turn-helix domain-containing protein [Enterococcus faecium]|nr:helix-turn-helix domain-containing protein [Enterococcus faecium]